jgi:hypothetical protein
MEKRAGSCRYTQAQDLCIPLVGSSFMAPGFARDNVFMQVAPVCTQPVKGGGGAHYCHPGKVVYGRAKAGHSHSVGCCVRGLSSF